MATSTLEVGDVWKYSGAANVDYERMDIVEKDDENGTVTVAFGGDRDNTSPIRTARWDDLFPNWELSD